MFCNVSPASYNVSETLCTLGFAARCRNVELGQAKKGVESNETKKLKSRIRDLEAQLSGETVEVAGEGDGAAAEEESSSQTPAEKTPSTTKKSPGKASKSASVKEKK
jgi:hypothetical protein